jgi:cytochrome c oxidase subunit III
MATELLDARVPAGRPLVERPGGPTGHDPVDFGDDGGGPHAGWDPARFGLWAFLGTVSMLFIGFTSAYIVRRTAVDWRALPAPRLLWWNTVALLLSSVTLERSRQRRRAHDGVGVGAWLAATGSLALLFVAGQLRAWRLLGALGYFLSSNPHSSFFYLLSGVHVVHVGGGLVWFLSVLWALRAHGATSASAGRSLSLLATYWHFLGALWLYVALLIFFF